MFIAQKLRKKNIIEYLLYMWQTEDLIRACELNIDVINERIISPQKLSDEDRELLYEWYESFIVMMKLENTQERGHLQINKNIIIELNELHQNLIQSGKDAGYSAKFYHILPYSTQLRAQQTDSSLNDLEICFNFLYGILLLKMRKTEISQETLHAQEEISKFMALLAKNYKLYKSGDLSFN